MICSRWIALVITLLASSPASAQIVQYVVTDLGFPPGNWVTSVAFSINNAGQVAGESTSSAPGTPATRAWRYTPGVGVVDLGSVSGTGGASLGSATANGINASGQVVGQTSLPAGVVGGAFRYTDGVGMVNLGALPGNDGSEARGINNLGQVTGSSFVSGTTSVQHAFRYTDGVGMVDLGLPAGATRSFGRAINNSGQVLVGAFLASGEGRAYRYTDALGYLFLGTLGGQTSGGNSINDSGQVVGLSDTASGIAHAFRYTDGVGMVDLGALLVPGSSNALGINNRGDVVGTSVGGAFLYRDGLGVTYLNSAIDPASGWTLGTPYDINESGQIVGTGFRGGVQRAFLLTPIPEPSALLFVGLAALGGAAARLRRCRCNTLAAAYATKAQRGAG